MTIAGLTSTAQGETPRANPSKLKESATQFEALMIGQMLKSVHESGGGWLGGGEDEASSAAVAMAEEHLAQTLASQGGLGLTSLVMQGLAKDEERLAARQ
jgi:Rod binding domain-containing protein